MQEDSPPLFPQKIFDSLAEFVYFAPWTSAERKTTLANYRLAGKAFNTFGRRFLFQAVIIGSSKRWVDRAALLVKIVDDNPTLLKCIKRVGILFTAPYAEQCALPLAVLLSRMADYPESAIERFRIEDPRPFITREPLKSQFIRLLWSGRVKELSISSVPSTLIPIILPRLHPSIEVLRITDVRLPDSDPTFNFPLGSEDFTKALPHGTGRPAWKVLSLDHIAMEHLRTLSPVSRKETYLSGVEELSLTGEAWVKLPNDWHYISAGAGTSLRSLSLYVLSPLYFIFSI